MSQTDTEIVCDTFMSKRGRTKLLVRGYFVVKNRNRDSQFYWKCNLKRSKNCPGRAITTLADGRHYLKKFVEHNHAPDFPVESNTDPKTSQGTVQNIVGRMKTKWDNLMTVYRREMTKVMFIESTLGHSSFSPPDTVPQMPSFGNFQQMLFLENSRKESNCTNGGESRTSDPQKAELNLSWLQLFTQETSYDPNGTVSLTHCSESVDETNGTESRISNNTDNGSTRYSKVKVEYDDEEEDDDDYEVLSEGEHMTSCAGRDRSRTNRTPLRDTLNSFTTFVENMLRDMPQHKRKRAMLSISQVLFNDDHDNT